MLLKLKTKVNIKATRDTSSLAVPVTTLSVTGTKALSVLQMYEFTACVYRIK